MSPHFETVRGENIGYFHNPFSWNKDDANKCHLKVQQYAEEHQIAVVEVADGRGQPCAECKEINNRYQPQK